MGIFRNDGDDSEGSAEGRKVLIEMVEQARSAS
jgi:hypothetical protein